MYESKIFANRSLYAPAGRAAGSLYAAQPPATACPECPAAECPEAPACPTWPTCPAPEEPVWAEVPFEEEWANSPHNDAEAEAFVHWDEDEPPEVPTSCAKCHTSAGYQEYVATGQGTVSAPIPAPAGTIQCVTCHNEAASTLTSVKFPQAEAPEEGGDPVNVELTGLGPEARCMVCHQGRASTD